MAVLAKFVLKVLVLQVNVLEIQFFVFSEQLSEPFGWLAHSLVFGVCVNINEPFKGYSLEMRVRITHLARQTYKSVVLYV